MFTGVKIVSKNPICMYYLYSSMTTIQVYLLNLIISRKCGNFFLDGVGRIVRFY